MEYDLELDNAVRIVKDSKAKKVCVQLPDGRDFYTGASDSPQRQAARAR